MNWHLFLSLFALLIYSPTMSQIAIINSKEGYSNVRRTASAGAEIVTVLQNNSAVIIDATAMEEGGNDAWLKVYVGADPYCLSCTANLKEGYNTGYIHQSHIKNLEELDEVNNESIFMRYSIVPFKSTTKKSPISMVQSPPSMVFPIMAQIVVSPELKLIMRKQ